MKDVWANQDEDLESPSITVLHNGPDSGMLLYDSAMGYFSVQYDSEKTEFYGLWQDDAADATVWEWASLEFKNGPGDWLNDVKSVIRVQHRHQRLGRHRICLKWVSQDKNLGIFDIQPCNRRMEKMTFGCATGKDGKDYFGLLPDAKKKKTGAMRHTLSDPMSGRSICKSWPDYDELVRSKFGKNHGGDLFAADHTAKECVPDDVWENTDGNTCTDLKHQKNQEAEMFDAETVCQTKDDDDNYVYEKCPCLECEPVVCSGAFTYGDCTDEIGWGVNKQQMEYVDNLNEGWAGTSCPFNDGEVVLRDSQYCPYIVNCEGEQWLQLDECQNGNYLEFLRVDTVPTRGGVACSFNPGTRRETGNASPIAEV